MKSLCILSFLSFVLFISLGSVHSSPNEDSEKEAEAPELRDYIRRCFARINRHRERHGVPKLLFDSGLGSAAESCAKLYAGGADLHSCPQSKGLSENVAVAIEAVDGQVTVEELCRKGVRLWYAQHKKYNYEHPNVTDWRNTGSFTYMVWKSSTAGGIGCAKGTKITQCVALFRPKGNTPHVAAYKANVLPPIKPHNEEEDEEKEETQDAVEPNINISNE